MLLIDEVAELDVGTRVTAKFFVDPARDIFRGHFPGAPVLPGVYTVEIMAQAADILLLSLPCYAGTTPYFIGINEVRFMKKIEPGDTVEVRVSIDEHRTEKAIATCYAEVYSKGEKVCHGKVTLAMR
jgi:3-hydroxyacyl-[acyl-carrier-protein] dehydratase